VSDVVLKPKNVYLLAHGVLWTYNLAKKIVMTDRSLRSVSVFVSDAAKHFTRSDGINKL